MLGWHWMGVPREKCTSSGTGNLHLAVGALSRCRWKGQHILVSKSIEELRRHATIVRLSQARVHFGTKLHGRQMNIGARWSKGEYGQIRRVYQMLRTEKTVLKESWEFTPNVGWLSP